MRSIKIRVLTFATLLALALSSSPTHAAPPTTDDLPRIAQLLAGSERARIMYRNHTITVTHPMVDSTGLAFGTAIGYPPGRPALIVSGPRDSFPPLPNPVPWESIERLEGTYRTRSSTAMFGAMLGLIVGITGAVMEMQSSGSSKDGVTFGVCAVSVGAVLGGGFVTTAWRRVHPDPEWRATGQPR